MPNKERTNHIGFICDGNGRWAKSKNKIRIEGHLAGMSSSIWKTLIDWGKSNKYSHMSFYIFSTENWNRPKLEVSYLMLLFQELSSGSKWRKLMRDNDTKVNFIGEEVGLKRSLLKSMREIEEITKNNKGINLTFCMNYGGKADILQAVNKCIAIGKTEINEKEFEKHLRGDLPMIDILVRTGGSSRTSNFLPWHITYADMYFPSWYWPELDREKLDLLTIDIDKRKRRFGGIGEEEYSGCEDKASEMVEEKTKELKAQGIL